MKPTKLLMQAATVFALAGLPSFLQASPVMRPAPEFSVAPRSDNQIGLRVRYTAFASAPGDFEIQSDSPTALPLDWHERISRAGSVVGADPDHPATESFAEFQALTSVGKLSGLTRARVQNGVGNASASVYMQFMDVVQVDKGGKLDFNWAVSGTVDNKTHPFGTNFAASSARAELFVWPYGTFPETGQGFPFTVYARSIFDPAGNTHLLPEVLSYPAGSRWWVLGQITITSTARSDHLLRVLPPHVLESTGDFRHTAELFIAPDPSTPDASFHAASGFNYSLAPIPEPSTYLLVLAGTAVLALRIGRRRRPGTGNRN